MWQAVAPVCGVVSVIRMQFVTCNSNLSPLGSLTARSISVTFVQEKDGKEYTVQAPIGKHLLEVAHDNDIELEGALYNTSRHGTKPGCSCQRSSNRFSRQPVSNITQHNYITWSADPCPFSPTAAPKRSAIVTFVFVSAGACEASLACSTCHVVVEVCGPRSFLSCAGQHSSRALQ